MITKMVIDAINKNEDKGNGFVVPIGVSARHIHLTQEHVEALFGEGYQLTKKKDLMGGQTVCIQRNSYHCGTEAPCDRECKDPRTCPQ